MGLEERLKRSGIVIAGGIPERLESLDSNGHGLRFVADLQDRYKNDLNWLLQNRDLRQNALDKGSLPNFNEFMKEIRLGLHDTMEEIDLDDSWKVSQIPPELEYRWVELTGPANTPNLVRSALNSGANTWMADYGDSLSPTLLNVIANTFYLKDAILREGDFHPKTGQFTLNQKIATLMTGPRGLHLEEKHMLLDGKPVSATIFDLGMIHYHLSPEQIRRGQTPAHYIPKLEHRDESMLLSDLLSDIGSERNMPKGIPKVSLLIENIFATFQAAEMLHSMKDYAIALNVTILNQNARWYRAFRNHPDKGLPDREEIKMTLPFMLAYQKYILNVCQAHGAQPMGGMEAAVPARRDAQNYEAIMHSVINDAAREAELGFYGKRAAHPDTVAAIREEFKRVMGGKPTQPYKFAHEPQITQAQLLEVPQGPRTYSGMVRSAEEAIEYNANWVRGRGAVAPKGNMLDLSASEIAWQELAHRLRHGTFLDDGKQVNEEMISVVIAKAAGNIMSRLGPSKFYEQGHGLGAQILADSIKQCPSCVPHIAYKFL